MTLPAGRIARPLNLREPMRWREAALAINEFARDVRERLGELVTELTELERRVTVLEDAPEAAGDVLWTWNETDVSQFSANLLTPSTGTAALSVATGAESRPVVRETLTGFSGPAAFAIDYALPRRWRARVEFCDNQASNLVTDCPAFFVCNGLSGASFQGIGFELNYGSNNIDVVRYEGGVRAAVGATTTKAAAFNASSPNRGAIYEIEFEVSAIPCPASPPVWKATVHALSKDATTPHGGSCVRSTQMSFGGTWAGKSLDHLAIGARFGSQRTGTIDLKDLQLLLHPMDR